MLGTMQAFPLSVNLLFRQGAGPHHRSQVSTFDGQTLRRASFGDVAARVLRLATVLRQMGIRPGDRVGSLLWNTQEHLEAYLAVPLIGAVLHTMNPRLFPDQLAYTVNHAGNRLVITDTSMAAILDKARPQFTTVEKYLTVGDGYEEALAAAEPATDLPDPENEHSAAAICYTSGTTGNPKGVVYSHRSIYLHSMAICTTDVLGLCHRDKLLQVPSMFHASGWGLPYAAWMAGSDMLLPSRFLQGEPLSKLIAGERPTVTGGVPTIWSDVSRYAEAHGLDLSSIRAMFCAGSAVPRSLIERFDRIHNVRMTQAWGMTETSPLAASANAPKWCATEDEAMAYRARAGRGFAGVEYRIASEGVVQPNDGMAVGEIQVRGPWVTGIYLGGEGADKFEDGWLKTGDVGTLDAHGFITITDRAKDVIKSGGEWVSSVEVENAIMGHADVLEAAVIGVPDPRWDERPLACVVLKPGSAASAASLRAFLADRVAKWCVPDRWAFIEEVPKTSVGKFDKKNLRARFAAGEITVVG